MVATLQGYIEAGLIGLIELIGLNGSDNHSFMPLEDGANVL